MDNLILTLLAIFLPFVGPAIAVYMKGASTTVVLACLLLGICFHFPGLVIALVVIWTTDPPPQGTAQ